MGRYVNGVMGADWTRYNEQFTPIIARSLVLHFLDEKSLPGGKMTWANHPEMAAEVRV